MLPGEFHFNNYGIAAITRGHRTIGVKSAPEQSHMMRFELWQGGEIRRTVDFKVPSNRVRIDSSFYILSVSLSDAPHLPDC
ncbi:hypothetical protein [Streptomyces sp. DSM 40750]|uniref:hypothetical protein n=1 Tax=Streptomyces sp. DSM 40750 TaxID=2801030 RepID=UPI00214AE031|nr:hypothetical protein [Streptomyces sp. DSM 40750]UUU22183.1 hypothetical protein JIX55_18745 [Streptomyces sp. DSM 40750]